MDPSVGEQDDHVLRTDGEQLVGMVGSGMGEGAGRQAVSPTEERRILGQAC